MATWPPTLDEVKGEVTASETPLTSTQEAQYQLRLDAAVDLVETLRPDLAAQFAAGTCPAKVKLGTVMLFSRYWARKDATGGLLSYANGGGTGAVPFNDPDIERLLGIGRYKAIWFV